MMRKRELIDKNVLGVLGSHTEGDHMVRAKKGTWCAGTSQNGSDHIMRTKKRELTDLNGLGVLGPVRMEVIT